MLKRKRWVISLVILVVLVSASVTIWLRVRAANARLVEGILTDVPCGPPCWQGITPGTIVDRREVIRQLRRTPSIGTVWESVDRVVDWRWICWPGYNSIYIEWDGTVASISLSVDFELTVEEIIAKYGLPDAVNVVIAGTPENQYGGMGMYYPARGMSCRVKVMPDYAPVLTPQSPVYEVHYTVPVVSTEAWRSENAEQMSLQPWPGYGELEVSGPQSQE